MARNLPPTSPVGAVPPPRIADYGSIDCRCPRAGRGRYRRRGSGQGLLHREHRREAIADVLDPCHHVLDAEHQ